MKTQRDKLATIVHNAWKQYDAERAWSYEVDRYYRGRFNATERAQFDKDKAEARAAFRDAFRDLCREIDPCGMFQWVDGVAARIAGIPIVSCDF